MRSFHESCHHNFPTSGWLPVHFGLSRGYKYQNQRNQKMYSCSNEWIMLGKSWPRIKRFHCGKSIRLHDWLDNKLMYVWVLTTEINRGSNQGLTAIVFSSWQNVTKRFLGLNKPLLTFKSRIRSLSNGIKRDKLNNKNHNNLYQLYNSAQVHS